MTGRGDPQAGSGFSVLDGAALVAGAAVASVHIRGVLRDGPDGPGGVVVWFTFAWVALTAAGPFTYVLRKYARKVVGFPQVGERLWALLGLPWLVTAALQNSPGVAPRSGHGELLTACLTLGLGAASLTALAVVWVTWVAVTPDQARATFSAPWTNRVGLILAVAWPVQCGAGMVVIG